MQDTIDIFEIHFDLVLALNFKIWLDHDPETGCRCVAPAPAAEVAGVTFSDCDSASVPKFLTRIRVRKFSNLKIRLLFRLRLLSMQKKFSYVFI